MNINNNSLPREYTGMRYSPFPNHLIVAYNNADTESWGKKYNAEVVSETQASQENRRISPQELIIFEITERGSFWVIRETSSTFWLFPRTNNINRHNYPIIKSLFECRNYRQGYECSFDLIRPAKVHLREGK